MKNTLGNSKNKMCDKGNLTQYLFLKLGFVTKLINEMLRRKANKEQTFQLTSLLLHSSSRTNPSLLVIGYQANIN